MAIYFADFIRAWTQMIQQLPVVLDSFLNVLGCLRQSLDSGKDYQSRGGFSLQICDKDFTLTDVP